MFPNRGTEHWKSDSNNSGGSRWDALAQDEPAQTNGYSGGGGRGGGGNRYNGNDRGNNR